MNEEEKNVEPIVSSDSVNSTGNTTSERKGFNITSMILGIISVVSFCWWYLSIPAGIVAIIFSIAGKKDAGRGMGVAGLVLGIIGLVLCVIAYLYVILIAAAISAF